MAKKRKTARWILPLGLFLLLNIMMMLLDHMPWTLKYRDVAFINQIMSSRFFTEWFTPYHTPEFNVWTVLFAIILLPEAIINAVEYFKTKREIES